MSVFVRGCSFLLAGVHLHGQSPGFVGGGGVVVVWWWGRWWLVVVGGGGSSGPVVQLCRWCTVLSCRRVRVVIVGLSFGRTVVCGCCVVVGGWVLGVFEGRFGGGARRSWAGG